MFSSSSALRTMNMNYFSNYRIINSVYKYTYTFLFPLSQKKTAAPPPRPPGPSTRATY